MFQFFFTLEKKVIYKLLDFIFSYYYISNVRIVVIYNNITSYLHNPTSSFLPDKP